MAYKVSWLDSCKQESSVHITQDNVTTLCGHPFAENFSREIWKAYKVGGQKNVCKGCLARAKEQHLDFKRWSSAIPARDFTEIPPHLKRWP